MPKKWYVVQAFAGQESKVRETLQQRIKDRKMEAHFGEIFIPPSEDGTKRRSSLPGYMFVEMEMSEDAWYLVKDTPKITGFIGNQNPRVIPVREIEAMRGNVISTTLKPRHSFESGDEIQVIDGPFMNFLGIVEEAKPEKQKLTVKVSIFGRATPVELDYTQVARR